MSESLCISCVWWATYGSDCPWSHGDKIECDGYEEISYESHQDEEWVDIDSEQEVRGEGETACSE